MLWNEEILFIHTPKTGGMSITELFIKYLKGQVNITGPYENTKIDGITYHRGKRHETLVDAESFFMYRNKSIFDFKHIFLFIRNPYDLELSRYTYLRKGFEQDNGPAQKIALESTYLEYLKIAPFFGMNPPRLEQYFLFNSLLPKNLIILRYENFEDEIRQNLTPYLKPDYQIPHINVSKNKGYAEYYNKETEQLCYQRNRIFFDKAFYRREIFD